MYDVYGCMCVYKYDISQGEMYKLTEVIHRVICRKFILVYIFSRKVTELWMYEI